MIVAGYRPIDCDVHLTVPSMLPLLPYMDDYWRDHLINRGTDKLNLTLTTQPLGAPIMGRADWLTPGKAPGSDLAALRRDALDAFGSRVAIAHCVHTGQVFYSEDMAAAVCRALNDYIAREWLDREPRLRASIVVPAQSPDLAVQEIERRAADRRFVEIQVLSMNEMPLGRRYYWPIYEAAQRHDLPIGVHAGGGLRCPPTPIGWPSYFLEDYVGHAQVFQSQLLSLISEGVFSKFPKLKVVMIEFGLHLAARLFVAGRQDLARGAARGALGHRGAVDAGAPACSFHPAAGQRPTGGRDAGAGSGAYRFRRHTAVLDRLPALAL